MIRVLDKKVYDKIAAGEVIERPVSIVKELIENSIDAGSSRITCEIKNGGKTLIRVTDDGSGIPADQAETAFLRHATSKIEKAEDLEEVESLGFRGEALASIAAVTRTTLITKVRDSKTGVRIAISGGTVIEKEPVGCPEGSTMIVTDLFYNTPARRLFLKTDAAESGLISELIAEYALAYPDIAFQMISGGKILFTSTGGGDLKKTILAVTHQREYENLIEVEDEEQGIGVRACISRPSLTRASRRDQVFFVNGRVVKSRILDQAVSKGYRERLFENRYPVVFLLITMDPRTLDVNIHPAKREVRFHDEKQVQDAVSRILTRALATDDAVIHARDYVREPEKANGQENAGNRNAGSEENEQVDIKQILQRKREGDARREAGASADDPETAGASFVHEREEGALNTGEEVSSEMQEHGPEEPQEPSAAAPDRSGKPELEIDEPGRRPFTFDDLEVTGCVFDTYITCVDRESFYLIDQHAAHERIFYEKLVGNYMASQKLSQVILPPLVLDLPLTVSENEYDWICSLRDMGYAIEEFGPSTYIVKEIPTFMELSEAEKFIYDFTENLGHGQDVRNKVVIDKLITKSCKSAVKAHDHLSEQEQRQLIRDLAKCRNPFSCPHGRPTFIRFTKYDLERFFKRVQ
ncbi:MAG: DNA mismatch repair endonuclease MutL [Anaerovoracaceae bacterium]|jgi:DNA mismatch repair protein MutL